VGTRCEDIRCRASTFVLIVIRPDGRCDPDTPGRNEFGTRSQLRSRATSLTIDHSSTP
jgi:hypothetical protein